ncbi:hypothetical protein BJV78DRAFT_1236818 [Lactifluus subvellereus]|nr:hypothetical protein BJV78DRAFT_1236818 [Lactifluus subvellereus]
MTLAGIPHFVVVIFAVLHAASGILLSILALGLQWLFPSLKQLPPSFSHIFDPADITSDDTFSDETLESLPIPESNSDHVAFLLASQARARATRHLTFTPPPSLWTLKEYPSPRPPELGGEHVLTSLFDTPDTLCDSPPIASSELFAPPPEEMSPQVSSPESKHTHLCHSCRLLPFHRRCSYSHSSSLPDLSRHGLALPHLREADARRRSGSPSSDQNHRRSPLSKHVRKIAAIAAGHKVKHRKPKDKKDQPSASHVGRGRTDPYQAPYFFPSPVSPWAYDYYHSRIRYAPRMTGLACLRRLVDMHKACGPRCTGRVDLTNNDRSHNRGIFFLCFYPRLIIHSPNPLICFCS